MFLRSLIFILLFSSLSQAFLGHRLGGGDGGHPDLPDNSLIAMKASLLGRNGKPANQFKDGFTLEFDVRETEDHELVINHDSKIRGKRIYNMTLSEIRKYKIGCGPRIPCRHARDPLYRYPTLEDVLQYAVEWNLVKRMGVDIKHVYSDQAKRKMFELLERYRKEHGQFLRLNQEVVFVSAKDGFRSTFARKDQPQYTSGYYISELSAEQWCSFIYDSGYKNGVRGYWGEGDWCQQLNLFENPPPGSETGHGRRRGR